MIRAEVIYTGEYLRDSDKYNNKRAMVLSLLIRIGMLIAYAAVLVIGLHYEFGSDNRLFRVGAVVWLLFFIAEVRKLVQRLRVDRLYESIKPSEDKREFCFDDNGLTFTIRKPYSEIKREFSYQQLYGAAETNKYFFVHLYKTQVGIIGKDDITQGTAAELRELLMNSMPDRFVTDTEGRI